MKGYLISRLRLVTGIALFPLLSLQAQTETDAIMMNKTQFCSGLVYTHTAWNNYWEGTLKRNNENLGTVSSEALSYMANYGITGKLNVMVNASYVSTQASAGNLAGMKGLQDGGIYVKWIPLTKTIGAGKLTLFAVAGATAPLSRYVVDFQPLSVGMGTTNLVGRGMVDFNVKRITITGSAAYIRRSNVIIDRESYYDTELHLTNEVEMPDAAQYQLRTGYRGRFLIAEALLTVFNTLGGFDITRNNMPFPSNRSNNTSLGAQVKYTLKRHTNLAFVGGGSSVLSGRNAGQATAFNVGAFYAFYFSNKTTKN
jgi:hypothetical protein